MGFDISFHAVPHGLLSDTVVPYVLGELPAEGLDSLVRDAVRHAAVRFAANAWGLGIMKLDATPERFEAHLHVWGRPYFVGVDGTKAIADTIDRYLAATPDQVPVIVKEQLDALGSDLVDRVSPSESGTLPNADQLAVGVRQWVDLLREAVSVLRSGGGTVTARDGQAHDAAALVQRDLYSVLLEFGAIFQPGWMSRGVLWPTRILHEAGVDPAGRVIANTALCMPVYRAFPELDWAHASTIYENYMVGGAVSPGSIPSLREDLAKVDSDALNLQKIDEALADAAHRGVPFVEATEIYSGIQGRLN